MRGQRLEAARRVAALGLLVVALAQAGAQGAVGQAQPLEPDGVRGCYAVRGDRVLEDDGADRLTTPASVAKLFVVAAALHHLGPDHRVTTRLWPSADARPVDGVLEGDLVVEAAADPSWTSDPRTGAPARLAARVAARGVRRITGDLIVDRGVFGGRMSPASRAISEVSFGYGAATSALAVDGNSVPVEIAPGRRAGAAVSVRSLRRHPLRLINRMRTAPASLAGRGTVEAQPIWGSRTIILRGDYPLGEPSYRLELAVPDGDLAAAEALRAALDAEGVTLVGTIRLRTSGGGLAAQRSGQPLASFDSPPLRQHLEPILADSDNWQAEMLLLRLAAAVRGEGRPETGLAVIGDLLVDEIGVERASFVLDDASGLSPYTLITPRTVVALLDWSRRQPWGTLYLGALARPGQGTLAAWPALPRGTRAKTGTLRHTLALAGLVEPGLVEPGRPGVPPLLFACMLNHRPDDRPALRSELVGSVRGWLR